jgi:hypothetical protein
MSAIWRFHWVWSVVDYFAWRLAVGRLSYPECPRLGTFIVSERVEQTTRVRARAYEPAPRPIHTLPLTPSTILCGCSGDWRHRWRLLGNADRAERAAELYSVARSVLDSRQVRMNPGKRSPNRAVMQSVRLAAAGACGSLS